MAGRVNVKFVVGLTAVLVVVTGVAIYGAAQVLMKSAEDHARLAMQAEAEGDWGRAQMRWGDAVSEDRTNAEYLESFINAIQHKPNETALEYSNQFEKYRAGLRQLAELKKTDLAAHELFFDEFMLLLKSSGPSSSGYQTLIDEVTRVEGLLYDQLDSDLWKQLRRYRGIAVATIAQISADIDDEFLDGGLEDIEAALEVRPDDFELAVARFDIYNAKANRAKLTGRRSAVSQLYAAALGSTRDFASKNSGSLDAQFLSIQAEAAQAVREVEARELFGEDLTNARREALERFNERAVTFAQNATSADFATLNAQSLSRITFVLAMVAPAEAEELLSTIWAECAQANGDDRQLQMAYAGFLARLGRQERAIEILEPISQLPDVPVTTEGLLRFSDRNRALYMMTDASLERWAMLAGEGEERDQWLEKAKVYRDRLSAEVADDRAMMLYIDARLAKAEGRLSQADKLFRDFNTATNNANADGLRYASEVAGQLGNPGLERDLLEQALQIDPTHVPTLVRLSTVCMNLRDYEDAKDHLIAALDRRPDLDALRQQLEIVRALLNEDSTDPILTTLAQAQLAEDSGSPDRAIQLIREGLAEHQDDVRLLTALSNMLVEQELWAEASEYIDQGLAIAPDDRRLLALRTMADIAGDTNAAISYVEGRDDLSDIDRQLQLYRLHMQNEDTDSALQALDEAERLDPTNKQVVVYRFDQAIRNQDAATARQIYEANKERDIDGADGLAMLARVELAEGDQESARRTLQSAVERGSTNAVTLKLLADLLLDFGDTFNALERYRQALAVRPNDLDLLKGYIAVLTRLGRTNEALEEARKTTSIGQRDPQFREMWLGLEGLVGDKQLAYDRRLQIAENEPDNIRNATLLISLALDLRRFDEARARLDETRAKEDSLSLASLDARWHADRNDLQSANSVYSAFIASDANDINDPAAYLAFGRFLIERGRIEQGLTTIRQARLVQDSDRPVADAILADELFKLGLYEEAAPALQSLIDADFQADIARSRLIECYLRLGNAELAQVVIDTLDEEQLNALNIMLMRADVARLQGNDNESSQLIDQAIADYPDDPLGYMKRAAMLMSNKATLPDAAEDLSRAIELNPSNSDAYRLRSVVYNELGQVSNAAADIIASAEAAPDNTQLRLGAVLRLLEMDRVEEAANLVDSALERRPTDLNLMVGAGDTFSGADQHRTALAYYERAWEQSKTMAVGRRLVTCLLDLPRPDERRAREIARSAEISDTENPATFLLRALIDSKTGNTQNLRANLVEAYELVKNDRQRIGWWMSNASELIGTNDDMITLLSDIDSDRSLTPWASLFYAQMLVNQEGREREGIGKLDTIIETTQDQLIKLTAYKVRSMARYNLGNHAAAANDMQLGLDMAPNDSELLNNLAYVQVRHLNQADSAIELARQAIAANPGMREAYDTLGLAHLARGESAEAIAALETALSMAQSDADRAPVLIHLARARLESGNVGGAQEAAQLAREISINQPDQVSDETKEELEQILDAIRNQ
ncbi:MAG: hypothetical protein ED559_03000 [Phycisphaera sp.]|nr:MAG: hypothetical protein ED559_03000 [Phycisphaera sp.]